jgi:hypothetical protein
VLGRVPADSVVAVSELTAKLAATRLDAMVGETVGITATRLDAMVGETVGITSEMEDEGRREELSCGE